MSETCRTMQSVSRSTKVCFDEKNRMSVEVTVPFQTAGPYATFVAQEKMIFAPNECRGGAQFMPGQYADPTELESRAHTCALGLSVWHQRPFLRFDVSVQQSVGQEVVDLFRLWSGGK